MGGLDGVLGGGLSGGLVSRRVGGLFAAEVEIDGWHYERGLFWALLCRVPRFAYVLVEFGLEALECGLGPLDILHALIDEPTLILHLVCYIRNVNIYFTSPHHSTQDTQSPSDAPSISAQSPPSAHPTTSPSYPYSPR